MTLWYSCVYRESLPLQACYDSLRPAKSVTPRLARRFHCGQPFSPAWLQEREIMSKAARGKGAKGDAEEKENLVKYL